MHPWRLNGWVGVKSLSVLYLRKRYRKVWETWKEQWLGGVGVQRHGVTLF